MVIFVIVSMAGVVVVRTCMCVLTPGSAVQVPWEQQPKRVVQLRSEGESDGGASGCASRHSDLCRYRHFPLQLVSCCYVC